MLNTERAQHYADLFTSIGWKWRMHVPVDGDAHRSRDEMRLDGVLIECSDFGFWFVVDPDRDQHPKPRRGDVYITEGQGEARVAVNRVARDGAWADIRVTAKHGGSSWTKRQPLRDGRMPYPVRDVGREIAASATPTSSAAQVRGEDQTDTEDDRG